MEVEPKPGRSQVGPLTHSNEVSARRIITKLENVKGDVEFLGKQESEKAKLIRLRGRVEFDSESQHTHTHTHASYLG